MQGFSSIALLDVIGRSRQRNELVNFGFRRVRRRYSTLRNKCRSGQREPLMTKLVFGCGYLGRRVAKLWRQQGDPVVAVTRSASKAAELAGDGIQPLVADINRPESLGPIGKVSEIGTVLFAVGFDRSGRTIREVYVEGLAAVLRVLPAVSRLIYISSTGVYGQVTGDVVDETSPCQPTREGGKACLAAEQLLQQSNLAKQTIILRLAGIYGPDRVPRAKELQAGTAIAAPAQGYLNLIHVDDAAAIVLLAEERAMPPALYCVSDGQPVIRAEYYRELAQLVGAPPPRFIDPTPDSPAAQRAASDKRVSNARLLRDLAPTLRYPTYREGLRAIVNA
jgi:nucleoside-diphosphate-sugar epimerase